MLNYKNMTLRPLEESDLKNYEKWLTTEIEWTLWDAPWEGVEPVCAGLAWRKERILEYAENPPEFYGVLQIVAPGGHHIGWVSSYTIDTPEIIAVGLGIPPMDARGLGYGKNALLLFMSYIFTHKQVEELYTQTWSGNDGMLGLAKSIGFVEIGRIKGIRRVRGGRFDALTFSISKEEFFSRHGDIKT